MPTTSVAAAPRDAVLEGLVRLMMEPPAPAPWEALFEKGDHVRARTTYFLLHRHDKVDSQSFVTEVLERLLQQLNCRMERETIVYEGRVRGKILWPATLKSRYTGDYDPTRYVCLDARRRFDTPQNQLLRYVVETLWRCLRRVPEVMRAGRCFYPHSGRTDLETIGDRLAEMEGTLHRLRGHVRLREVELLSHVTPEHVYRAETSKMEEYGLAAELYRRYDAAVLSRSWDAVVRFSSSVLPLPARCDEEGERWLRLAASALKTQPADQATGH